MARYLYSLVLSASIFTASCSPTKPPDSVDGTSPSGSSTQGTVPGKPPLVNVASLVEAADASRGKKLYEEEHCGGCHGTQAKPPAKFPNLFTSDWTSNKLEAGFNTIKHGDSPMPAYGDKLSDNQVADLLRYFRAGD